MPWEPSPQCRCTRSRSANTKLGQPQLRARRYVVEEHKNGLRPVQKDRAKQPQAGQGKTRGQAKLTAGSENLITGTAVLGRVTMRHRHRTPVPADKGGLQTRKLFLG